MIPELYYENSSRQFKSMAGKGLKRKVETFQNNFHVDLKKLTD